MNRYLLPRKAKALCARKTTGFSTRQAAADQPRQLRQFIADGKKIIISTIQSFPFVLKVIGDEHRGRHFAIIIDEAHSSQSGKTAASMSETLGDASAF